MFLQSNIAFPLFIPDKQILVVNVAIAGVMKRIVFHYCTGEEFRGYLFELLIFFLGGCLSAFDQ